MAKPSHGDRSEVCCQGQVESGGSGSLPSAVAVAGLSPGSLWSKSRCRLHFCSGHWSRQCILDMQAYHPDPAKTVVLRRVTDNALAIQVLAEFRG